MLNRIILMGRLVADPELKTTTGGLSVAGFRMAVDRNYQSKEGGEKQADFIPCVAWRQTAEFIANYFGKGRMIAVEGSLQSRNYEDKTGAKRTAYEVLVDHAYFADSKPQEERQTTPAASSQQAAPPPQLQIPNAADPYSDDGDLPF